MTWQHLQQLRSTAQAAIRQQLADKQPVGGRGAIVQSSSIALVPDRRSLPVPEEKPWTAILYATVSYDYHGVDDDGKRWSSSGTYHANEVYAYRPGWAPVGWVQHTYEYEHTQFFELKPDEETGAYFTRRSTIKFEMRAVDHRRTHAYENSYYRMPFKVTLAHVISEDTHEHGKVVKTKEIIIGRGGATYRPEPDALDTFYEVKILDISRA